MRVESIAFYEGELSLEQIDECNRLVGTTESLDSECSRQQYVYYLIQTYLANIYRKEVEIL